MSNRAETAKSIEPAKPVVTPPQSEMVLIPAGEFLIGRNPDTAMLFVAFLMYILVCVGFLQAARDRQGDHQGRPYISFVVPQHVGATLVVALDNSSGVFTFTNERNCGST